MKFQPELPGVGKGGGARTGSLGTKEGFNPQGTEPTYTSKPGSSVSKGARR